MSIFISYRRNDSSGYAGRLFDDLAQRFGREQVFTDIETLEPGVDFVEGIDQAIKLVGAVIVLIGPSWTKATDSSGHRRLDNPHDFIRLEITAAIKRGVQVIPVLVHGAVMPQEQELPEPLRPLCRLQACEISDDRWESDVSRLGDALAPSIAESVGDLTAAPPTMPIPAGPDRSARGMLGSLAGLAGGVAAAVAGAAAVVGGAAVSIGEVLKSNRQKPSERKPVDFAAFGPESIAPNGHTIIDIWAYPAGEFNTVQKLASEVERGHHLGRKVGLAVEPGTLITVELFVNGLTIESNTGSLVWEGSSTNVSFVVYAPTSAKHGTYQGKVIMRIEGIKLGELALVLRVDSQAAVGRTWCAPKSHRFHTAFASYASDDREQVFARLQGIKKAVPDMEIFVDVSTLRSGEDWEERLSLEVPTKDIFYLFWSKAAANSEWVDREWKIAFDNRGLNYIDPVPLEDPRDLEVPDQLKSLHFNDAYLIHAEYETLRKRLQDRR